MGFVLGFFISGRMAKKRIKHIHEMTHNPKAEGRHWMKRLDLTEEQESEIKPILDSMLPVHKEVRQKHRAEMDSLRNEMFQKITPHLKDNQIQKLERIKEHRASRPPHGPRHDRQRSRHSEHK